MDLDFDNLMSDLDAVIFARAGSRKTEERDPVEVKLEREVEANHYKVKWHEARKAGAK